MIPDTAMVMRWRFGVGVVVRGASILAVFAGVVGLVRPVHASYANWGMFSWPDIRAQFILPAALVLVGVAAGLTAWRIAIWLVPIQRPACPACGYSFEGARGHRCPECGIDLPGAPTTP